MDAKLVWDTWRRILKSDDLVERVVQNGDLGAGEAMGLTGEQRAVLAEYAGTPVATDTNIGMYRRGLVRNAQAALSYVPLTRTLLSESGLEFDDVAADFVRSTGYRDDGPNFWRTAGDFIAYLAALPEFAEGLQQDLLAVEAAAVALVRRLGESAPAMWPDNAASRFSESAGDRQRADSESTRYVASRAATAVSSSYDLTEWLENPEDFHAREAEPSTHHWLIYFPDANATHEYAELSEDTARVFKLLSTPKTASEVSMALGGDPAAETIDSLAEIGVVVTSQ